MVVRANALGLPASVMAELHEALPAVAARTVLTIIDEVPGYADASEGPIRAVLEQAVQMALAVFLRVAARSADADPGRPLKTALDAAYTLGRGEATRGRSPDSLLAAYRVGARSSWRELASIVADAGTSANTMSQFAELVFAYIDELSAASLFGHSDELASSDRVHQRYRDRLARSLVAGDPADVLAVAAEQANWRLPTTLTAVLLPTSHGSGLRLLSDTRVLQLGDDLPGARPGEDLLLLLIPTLTAPRVRAS